MKKLILAVLMVAMTAGFAHAVPMGQPWFESGVGDFNRIELYMLGNSINGFNPVTTHPDGNPAWSSEVINPDFVRMVGPAVSVLYFTTGFTAPTVDPFNMDFAAFRDVATGDLQISIPLEAAHIAWTGSYWQITDFTQSFDRTDYNTTPVPEPGTAALFVLGGVGLFLIQRRRTGVTRFSAT